MQLETEILGEHSRERSERIAAWIGNDGKRFKLLMELFLKGDYRITQRASWIVNICSERYPGLIRPYLKQMIERMQEPEVHPAVRRNVIRILQFIEIPRHLLGTVATVCFQYLGSHNQPIAVRVFSMTVLGNIARLKPDFRRELRLVIEQQLPYGSAGFRARARKVLAEMENSKP
jgi:hypothetical protein